jgi:hypothetical protein
LPCQKLRLKEERNEGCGVSESPSLIVSHELPLDQAPDAYKNFDQRADGWTKVLLKPGRRPR